MKRLYTIEYMWVENEHEKYFVITDLRKDEFEELLGSIIKIAHTQKYDVNCLPEVYRFVIDELEKRGCICIRDIVCDEYIVDDGAGFTYEINRRDKETIYTKIAESGQIGQQDDGGNV